SRAQRHLDDLAHLDLLTGLPNRAAFEESLRALLRDGAATGRVTVLAVELQRFAAINETYGFEVGDALMAEVAGHLRDALRRGELLARVGGAQFAVAAPTVSTQAVARARAAELQQVVRAPFRIGRDTLRIAANVGFVVTDHTAADAGEV